jgi:hypothetical protein
MINTTVFRKFLVVMFAMLALSFTGCSSNDDDDDDPVDDYTGATAFTITVNEAGKYFSFTDGLTDEAGKLAAAANDQNWDIGFNGGRYIYTNSGATKDVLGSNGVGGVWFTGWTKFKNLTALPADTNFAGTHAVDTTYWIKGMGPSPAEQQVNVMTYAGYYQGSGGENDGSEQAKPLAMDPVTNSYYYNQYSYYRQEGTMSGSGPTFPTTDRVYIIKHGTGNKYTAIQIIDVSGTAIARTYVGYYQTLP